jgi:hypothetical protein
MSPPASSCVIVTVVVGKERIVGGWRGGTHMEQQSDRPRQGRQVAGAHKVLFDGDGVQVMVGLTLNLLRVEKSQGPHRIGDGDGTCVIVPPWWRT